MPRTDLRPIAAMAAVCVLQAFVLAAPAAAQARQYTFSWPFEPDDGMRPRGGTSTGAGVELAEGPTEAWRRLAEPGIDAFERDRRAILAMAGGYRTSFDFIETVGFTRDYAPARPYQSWGTEYVYVVADEGDFISLQHVMVMFVEDAEGRTHGPIVQKHWRQDWRYEDTDLHVYAGHGRYRRQTPGKADARGRWSQAVFQVDDSPRYEALGRWRHEAGYSAWTSDTTWRPLPRRESSVRDDYDVLIGTNRHTITPTGWVQEEENLKAVLDERGKLSAETAYRARELGVNRYERVVDFDFAGGDAYWDATSAFWADVRDAWAEIYARNDAFVLRDEVGGRALFEPFFEYAARLDSGEPYAPGDAAAFIDETLNRYVEGEGQ